MLIEGPGPTAGNAKAKRPTKIRVRGARTHNLRDVDIDIPRDKLVVFTGISGSGKSSLAFDTIFAEGQRRYLESLSSYARMFLGRVDRPDVDRIDGLAPAVAIDQRSTSRNPRSTVGTATEVHDYLRLLWARAGTPHCPTCGAVVQRQSVQDIADQILQYEPGVRYQLTAPIARQKKGTFDDTFKQLSSDGYARAVVDGETVDLSTPPPLQKTKKHDIHVVVDRLTSDSHELQRVVDSVETALRLSDGVLAVNFVDRTGNAAWQYFSEAMSCPLQHAGQLAELAPRVFSFNAPFGACQECSGLGTKTDVDVDELIGDDTLTIRQGALLPWSQAGGGLQRYAEKLLESFAEEQGFSLDTRWIDLPEVHRTTLLHGLEFEVTVEYRNRFGRMVRYTTGFEGAAPLVRRKFAEADSDRQRDRYSRFMREVPCGACGGARLTPAVLAVTLGGKSIADASALSLDELRAFLQTVDLTPNQAAIADPILRDVVARLTFLTDVGLHYLSLSRAAASLSGGEAQRIRLATQIGTALRGVIYVLDEPSIGLHQRDNDRLIQTLKRLRDLGNSVLVVEHDADTMLAADHIVDVGPGAGVSGGGIVYNGSFERFERSKSITADYLAGRRTIAMPAVRRAIDSERTLRVRGARANTLRDVDVDIPLGTFVAVTGVSGSGKSSLVNEVIAKALASRLNRARAHPGSHRSISGFDTLEKIVHVDQSPIGRTPRSNPATYTGVFDRIRELFAETTEAKTRGYAAARFSFNVKGGRCEQCMGDGIVTVEMNFLPSVEVVCEVCNGARFNRETLQVEYAGKNIAEVLALTIEEAAEFFRAHKRISRFLSTLVDVGLGYMALGQSATTLSGGEAQRVKLATELQRRTRGRNFYVLDEPTTGLHFEDVRRLLEVLHALVDQGNTVVTIEHNIDVIKTADWIIEMGPDGGAAGGDVVIMGRPEEVAQHPTAWTAPYLSTALSSSSPAA